MSGMVDNTADRQGGGQDSAIGRGGRSTASRYDIPARELTEEELAVRVAEAVSRCWGRIKLAPWVKSLRDEFAMAAMQGDWAAQTQGWHEFKPGLSKAMFERSAKLYYRMADAMMDARKPSSQPQPLTVTQESDK
jgi:hypothetical protein